MYPMILLFPIVLVNANHESQNQSDVIITYSNHAEADLKPKPAKKPVKIMVPEKYLTEKTDKSDREFIRERVDREKTEERVSDEVVFIPNAPNERELIRNEDYLMRNPISMSDYFGKRTVDSIMNSDIRVATETPSDIIFLSGRNDPNENIKEKKHPFDEIKQELNKETELNCTNLDCNNTIDSVCGGKVEHKLWRYRLFLNECFFRKVNCYFTHVENRFHQVPMSKCSHIAAHVVTKPAPYQFLPDYMFRYTPKELPRPVNNKKKAVPSRRSLFKGLAGKACEHACPVACPDDYEPECAVSKTGTRRVFLNHCKLDYNSCAFKIAWYKRPLAECVGGKKADLRQNRGFIDWMQRIGIVDNKGKLVLS